MSLYIRAYPNHTQTELQPFINTLNKLTRKEKKDTSEENRLLVFKHSSACFAYIILNAKAVILLIQC